ncbi:MAG: ComF family protein [Candidatus Omnitrophica bacterium]|nr:ComF family protein [Candidatus Omnitrophota bacterium]
MLNSLLTGLRDLIYPNYCLACENKLDSSLKEHFICTACQKAIEPNLPPFCPSCGRTLDTASQGKNTCSGCLNTKFSFDRAFSPCKYSGIIKKMIQEFKYSGRDYLGKNLGQILNNFIKEYDLPITHTDYIIPIPLHNARFRQREFNQAQILSAQVAKEFNKQLLLKVLTRTKATKSQTELSFEERRNNVQGSFSVTAPQLIKDKNLLLIDDVLTTGSTLDEAARTLKAAGAKMILAMTLAN